MQQRGFHVALQFLHAVFHLQRHFRRATGFVDHLLGAGHAGDLVADLRVVVDARVSSGGVRGGFVAFDHGVGAGCGGQRAGLPFVLGAGGLALGERGQVRRFRGRHVIDDVAEVFAVAYAVVGGKGICGLGHFESLKVG